MSMWLTLEYLWLSETASERGIPRFGVTFFLNGNSGFDFVFTPWQMKGVEQKGFKKRLYIKVMNLVNLTRTQLEY